MMELVQTAGVVPFAFICYRYQTNASHGSRR